MNPMLPTAPYDGSFQDFAAPLLCGNDYALLLTVWQPNDEDQTPPWTSANATNPSLAGYTALWFTLKTPQQVQSNADDAAVVYQTTLASGGITILSPSVPQARVSIARAALEWQVPGIYQADLKAKDASGLEHTLVTGTITVRGPATRST